MKILEMTVQELNQHRKNNSDLMILDVRNMDEYQLCNLGGYLIPHTELADRLNELDSEKTIVIHCHAGGRSRRAAEFLMSKGFKNVYNLTGGITAWANEIDPGMPTY